MGKRAKSGARLSWAVVMLGQLWAACASAPAGPSVVSPPTESPKEPAALPLASSLSLSEWLPAGAALAARVDLVALQQAGPLTALLQAWLGEHSSMLENARRVYIGVLPVADTERVVMVIEAEQAPVATGEAAWTPIARDAWVSCVRACGDYTLEHAPIAPIATPAPAGDVRAALARTAVVSRSVESRAPQELALVCLGDLLDDSAPAKVALRDRLLDTSVGVASELREGTLRITQVQGTLSTELHARFTSRGVASSASLLARGAVFEAADALEEGGLTREADLLYGLSTGLGEDDMTAKLSMPLDAVPTLVLAWLAKRSVPESAEPLEDGAQDPAAASSEAAAP